MNRQTRNWQWKSIKKWKVNAWRKTHPLATFGIKDEIKKQIDKMVKIVKCAKKVVGEEVAGSDYKKNFEEFKAKVNGILQKDATKCAEMKGLKEKFL